VHPIVLGVGKKVFDGGAVPTNITLLEAPAAGPKAPCTCAPGSPMPRLGAARWAHPIAVSGAATEADPATLPSATP